MSVESPSLSPKPLPLLLPMRPCRVCDSGLAGDTAWDPSASKPALSPLSDALSRGCDDVCGALLYRSKDAVIKEHKPPASYETSAVSNGGSSRALIDYGFPSPPRRATDCSPLQNSVKPEAPQPSQHSCVGCTCQRWLWLVLGRKGCPQDVYDRAVAALDRPVQRGEPVASRRG